MYWPGGDADFCAGILLASTRSVHHVNTVGGKHIPPTIPPMQHDGALVVLKNISQDHIAVQEGEIAETTSFGGVEGKGGDLKGVQRLWAHPRDVDVLQIHGENTIGSR